MEVEVAVPPLGTCSLAGVGRSAKNSDSKGTAVKKNYQNKPVDTTELAIPERVKASRSQKY